MQHLQIGLSVWVSKDLELVPIPSHVLAPSRTCAFSCCCLSQQVRAFHPVIVSSERLLWTPLPPALKGHWAVSLPHSPATAACEQTRMLSSSLESLLSGVANDF